MGLIHAFSTREGGVSRPPYHALNLSLSVGDKPEAVRENRRRFFEALGVELSSVVRVRQVHGDGVLVVDENVVKQEGFPRVLLDEGFEYDATVTNRPGLALAIGTADCLPILLFDPRKGAIGAVHAGWRSTVKRIAEKTVKAMVKTYGTNPQDLLAAIGPGIGGCCYEVDDPVIKPLAKALPSWEAFVSSKRIGRPAAIRGWWNRNRVAQGKGRFHLDLSGVNSRILEEAGLPQEHIFPLSLCTSCRRDLFYSYRAERSRTGRMLSLIMLP